MYIEIAESLVKRGNLIKPKELENAIKNAKGELYRSLYIYDDSITEHIKNTGSIAQFQGTVYPDKILLDFDGDNAQKFTQEALLILEDNGVFDGFQIFFSGRGFHIELDNNLFNFEYSPSLPNIVKNTLSALFPNADPIWDKARIYRCANTLNLKSNLYKIPISQVELNEKIEVIHALATKPRFDWEYSDVIVEPLLQDKIVLDDRNGESQLPATKLSSDYKFACIHNMLSSKPEAGTRHDIMMRLASHFKRQGYTPNVTKLVLDDWIGSSLPENRKGEVNKIVKDVYSWEGFYTCQDPVMRKFCNHQCPFFRDSLVEDIDTAEKKMIERMESKRTAINLRDIWNLSRDYEIEENELVAINGSTGIGKSAFIQNIIYNIDLPTLYFSFEMPSYQLYKRFLQIGSGASKDILKYQYKKISDKYKKNLKHIKIITSPIFANEIPKYAEQTGCKLIVLDHIGLMRSKYAEEYNKISEITSQLRQITIKYPLIVVFISQVSRENAKSQILDIHSGKGSGSIENDSSKVITFNRESRIATTVRINGVKDREGQHLDFTTSYDNSNLRIGGIPRKSIV